MSDLSTTVSERQEKEKQALVDALKEMPIVQVACKKVGVSRATYYLWRSEDKQFRRLSDDGLGEGISFINDMSESQLITLIREKRMPAIALWLKHNHARYASKRQAHTPIANSEDLSPEEEKVVLEALLLASGGGGASPKEYGN